MHAFLIIQHTKKKNVVYVLNINYYVNKMHYSPLFRIDSVSEMGKNIAGASVIRLAKFNMI